MAKDYGVETIDVYEGPEGIRKNLSMYLGEDDDRGVVHCWWEVVGNSFDEATNGYGKVIRTFIGNDGSITVADEGRGIPVGPYPKDRKRDTMTILATVTHSSGKFASAGDNYGKGRIGSHGVGLAVVNAVSNWMELWSWRNNTWNYQLFKDAVPQTPKPVQVRSLPRDIGIEGQPNQGTVVRFWPNLSCFAKGAKFNPRLAFERLDEASWLVGDVKLSFQLQGKRPQIIHRPNGLRDRFEHEVKRLGAEAIFEPFVHHSDHVDVMIGWCSATSETVFSAVGAVNTREGGTHVRGLEAAITSSFAELATKSAEYDPRYLRTGMVAVVNVRFGETKPKFNSQDKVKLTSEEGKSMVYDALFAVEPYALWSWLSERGQKELREHVLAKAAEWTEFNAGIKATSALKAAYKTTFKGKWIPPKGLKVSRTENPMERELFLVEGDSAGGTAKDACDDWFQEVLPLRGKLKNMLKGGKEAEQALFTDSVVRMFQSIGYNPENPDECRVGKVVILTDGDVDGRHISSLLCGDIWKVMPNFIRRGQFFEARAPLYQYSHTAGKLYGSTIGELQQKFARAYPRLTFKSDAVTRMKGLGEANADVIHEFAFDKITRRLRRIMPVVSPEDNTKLLGWMGENEREGFRYNRLITNATHG